MWRKPRHQQPRQRNPNPQTPTPTAAVENLESLPEDQYRESSQILQLLRDNLQNWTAKDAA